MFFVVDLNINQKQKDKMEQFRIETPTKTFGKEAKKMLKEIFPNCVEMKFYGTKMNGMVNLYDNNGKHIGYWTNQYSQKGYFRNHL